MHPTAPLHPEDAAALIERLRAGEAGLPAAITLPIRRDLERLVSSLRDSGQPRVALIGRRGAGKSSLVNAMFGAPLRRVGSVRAQTGAPTWETYRRAGRAIRILDTRGLQEGSAPAEHDSAASAEASALEVLLATAPDLFLFLVKAKEVDAAIGEDLAALARIHRAVSEQHGRAAPIIGVLTQCDELDPSDIRRLPTDDDEKNANISQAAGLLERHMGDDPYLRDHMLAPVFPIVANLHFQADGSINPARDYRWNIDPLIYALLEGVFSSALFQGRQRAVGSLRRQAAESYLRSFSMASGGVGIMPIPIDLVALRPIWVRLALGLGIIGGHDLDLVSARALLSALDPLFDQPLDRRDGIRTILRFVPGIGTGASAMLAWQQTEAYGRALIRHLIEGEPIETISVSLTEQLKILTRRSPRGGDAGMTQ